MNSLEIILVLAGVPLAILVLLGLCTLGPNFRRVPRYRPGQEWNHPPVWWMAYPEELPPAGRRRRPPTSATHGGSRGHW